MNANVANRNEKLNLQTLDWDGLLNQIQAAIPLPMREESCADGSLVCVGGDPGEVVVRISNSRITISVFAIAFEESHTPVVRPQALMTLNWKRLPAEQLKTVLHEMIDAARQLRRANYRNCGSCGETKPPEWMHENGTCQSCARQSAAIDSDFPQ